MRIGVNCLNLEPAFVGGLNTFVRGLLAGFANVSGHFSFRVYATTRNSPLFNSLRDRPNFKIVELDEKLILRKKIICRASLLSFSENGYEAVSNWAFHEIRQLMDSDNDVVYTPSVVLQMFDNKKPTLLSMHDIQHVHYPEFFSWSRRLSRTITYSLSARRANFFQASSQFIRQDLLNHFDFITPERVAVIPEGVNIEDFRTPVDTTHLSSKFNIPARFLFLPAQLWPHKNHMTLLRALKHIEETRGLQIPLAMTGGSFSATPKILSYVADQSMDYVRYLGTVVFPDLLALYQKAELLVMPSLHESNSLPILEAAAAGTPIVASRIPPNEELARVLQLTLFEPLNHQELAECIFRLWDNPAITAPQVAHNSSHITNYSWDNSALRYQQLFEKMLAC